MLIYCVSLRDYIWFLIVTVSRDDAQFTNPWLHRIGIIIDTISSCSGFSRETKITPTRLFTLSSNEEQQSSHLLQLAVTTFLKFPSHIIKFTLIDFERLLISWEANSSSPPLKKKKGKCYGLRAHQQKRGETGDELFECVTALCGPPEWKWSGNSFFLNTRNAT